MPRNDLTSRIFKRAVVLGLGDELARRAGLRRERVEAIRRGDSYTADEYEQLCRALAVDPSAMYRAEETRPARSPARFRAAMGVRRPPGADLRLLALAVEQGRVLGHLMALLDRPVELSGHRQVRAPRGKGPPWREGYDLGEAARARLHPEQGPLWDVEGLLRGLGVHVARVPFSTPEIDAASVWQPEAVPVILLNKRSRRYGNPGAVRATLAHELCHLLHDAGEHDLTTQVSWGGRRAGSFQDAVEVRARAFAPAFLAPRGEVKAWFGGQPRALNSDDRAKVESLARYWGLSFEGAVWHAKNCGVIEADVAEALAATPGPRRVDLEGFTVEAPSMRPADVHPDLPERAADPWDGAAAEIILAALGEGHITAGRARELLTWG